MITVVIYINERPVIVRSARNVDVQPDDCESTYHLDDGTYLRHKRSDGAAKLAIAMLKGVEEP